MSNVLGQEWYKRHISSAGYDIVTENGSIKDKQTILSLALNTDIKEICAPVLSNELSKEKTSKIVLQIQKIKNISAPKANEESQAAPRLLKLTLSDGDNYVQAVELAPINSISRKHTPPGTKVLINNARVSLGYILLTPDTCILLGGRVPILVEKWELAKSVQRSQQRNSSDDGPPPWVNFGTKIQNSTQESNFKSLGNKSKDSNKENSEFELQRQGAIAEAASGAVKKVFGGRVKQNVQPVNNTGRNYEKRDQPRNKTKVTQKEREIEEKPQKPSTKVSLFSFLEDKLPINETQNTAGNDVPNDYKNTVNPSKNESNTQKVYQENTQKTRDFKIGFNVQRNKDSNNWHDSSNSYSNNRYGNSSQNSTTQHYEKNDNNFNSNPNNRYGNASQHNTPQYYEKADNNFNAYHNNRYGNYNQNNVKYNDKFDGNSSSHANNRYTNYNQNTNNTRPNEKPKFNNYQRYDKPNSLNQKNFGKQFEKPPPSAKQNSDSSTTQETITNQNSAVKQDKEQPQQLQEQVIENVSRSEKGNKDINEVVQHMDKLSVNSQFASRSLRQHLNLGPPRRNEETANKVEVAQNFRWNIGDECLAKYWEDGKFYNSEILAVTDRTIVVKFKGYGNIEEVLRADCVPAGMDNNRHYHNQPNRRHDQNGRPYSGSMEFRRSTRNFNQ